MNRGDCVALRLAAFLCNWTKMDFKSRASANFATRATQSIYRIIQDLVDHYRLIRRRPNCARVSRVVMWTFLNGYGLLHEFLYSPQVHAVSSKLSVALSRL
jgi:hypothetical protein